MALPPVIKPIRTTDDLTSAKRRLAELLGSEPAANDDEIEVLSSLIERFEANVQIDAPTPVVAIKFRMDQLGLTTRQLEPFIGSRARVSEVLSGKRQLSIDMIRSLHEGLGIPYASLIERRTPATGSQSVSKPALKQLKAFGFDVSPRAITDLLSAVQPAPVPALHRKTRTQRAASKTDQGALLLWQASVLRKTEGRPGLPKFDANVFGPEALRKLARLSSRPDGPVRAIKQLAHYGIYTVILSPLSGTYLDGAAMTGQKGVPVIGLTLRHDRIDSFWFTLLHEAAHIALHYDHLAKGGAVFIDDMEIQSEDRFEREADDLARESLIPSNFLSQVRWGYTTTHEDLLALSARARVHIAVAAGRWQREHQNYKKFSRLIERGTLRAKLASFLSG